MSKLQAYINGDDGYLKLTCELCEDTLRFLDAGDTLSDLLADAYDHFENTNHVDTSEDEIP